MVLKACSVVVVIVLCAAAGEVRQVAPKPLFRDPVHDGAADPVLVWNRAERNWVMFYTNRRANVPDTPGVSWLHGTRIGFATSTDGGAAWTYQGTVDIPYGPAGYTRTGLRRCWNTTALITCTSRWCGGSSATGTLRGTSFTSRVLDLLVESETYPISPGGLRADFARRDAVPYLDVVATMDSGKGRAALFLLNRDLDSEREVAVEWRDPEPTKVLACHTLTGPDLKAYNTFEQPRRVAPRTLDAPQAGARMTFKLPARSYTVAHIATS